MNSLNLEGKFLIYWFIIFYIIVLYIFWGIPPFARANSQYYYEAPDGTYDVLLSHVDYENSIVFFVLCESSGSELHGDFKFKEGLIFPSDYWDFLTVRLENNIITGFSNFGEVH